MVLNPGVLIAALISAVGAPRAILQGWIEGTCELLVSPKLLAELARVLAREKFRRYFTEQEAQAYVAFLRRFATLCADVQSPAWRSPTQGTTTSWPWHAPRPSTFWSQATRTFANSRITNPLWSRPEPS